MNDLDLGHNYNYNLNLLKYTDRLNIIKRGENTLIWDKIRKKYLKIGPEEVVRQLVVHYLILEYQCILGLISVEKTITVFGLSKRFDIVYFSPTLDAYLIVECKSPEVPLTQKVLDQCAIYNSHFKAKYFWCTNGHTNKIYQYHQSSQEYLPHFAKLSFDN